MATFPNIPTSFVPHSSGAPSQRFRPDLTGALGFLAYAILGIVFLLAFGVFFYGRILAAEQAAKDAELTKAEAAIDPASVANFLRLRDRLSLGNALLGKHPAFSGFFTSLGTLLPTTVRFSSFHVTLDSSGMARIEGSGVAKNFNALAAASTAFADDGRVKDAVFSKMTIGKDNSVSFGLSATLDPKLIVFSPEAATQPPPAASDAPTTPSP